MASRWKNERGGPLRAIGGSLSTISAVVSTGASFAPFQCPQARGFGGGESALESRVRVIWP